MRLENIALSCAAGLDKEGYALAHALKEACANFDGVTLKLELDYKLAAQEQAKKEEFAACSEFFALMDGVAVGYIGLCSFGGPGAPIEVTGMVHPSYRRKGIFTSLYDLALGEMKRRGAKSALLLCDKASAAGQSFLQKIGSAYRFSEAEMYLRQSMALDARGITLEKATDADAASIASMDALFWGEEPCEEEAGDGPEAEERCGATTYLARKDGATIGKVKLQKNENDTWGIYGFGVLEQYRRRGYGRAILSLAIQKLVEAGAKNVMLQVETNNESALNLYRSCGFIETSVMDYYELTVL